MELKIDPSYSAEIYKLIDKMQFISILDELFLSIRNIRHHLSIIKTEQSIFSRFCIAPRSI